MTTDVTDRSSGSQGAHTQKMLVNGRKVKVTTDHQKDFETEIDQIFDAGEVDILDYADLSSARRVNRDTQRFNLDTPVWMVNALDAEADRIGVTRQALVKMWLADRLGQIKTM